MIYDIINIGFGISGISATKNSIENFDNVLTLEKEPKFGGCWYSKSYPDVKLQTIKNSYMFSSLDMDDNVPKHPGRDDIMNYLQNYIEKYKLERYVKYNSKVNSVYYDENKWCIEYYDGNDNNEKKIFTKYLVMCSGIYNDPKTPDIKNLYKYENKFINSNQFSYKHNENYKVFKNKNVFVIGNGPTGCDMACNAVKNGAKNVTLLFRSNRWIFKRNFQSLVIVNRLFFTLLQKLPRNLCLLGLYIIFFVIYYLKGYHKDIDLPNELVNRNTVVFNEDFYKLFNSGKIKYIQVKKLETTTKSIIINDIYRKKCDLIINAIGYDTNIPLGKDKHMNSIPLLYKRIVHPSYNTLGFIGFSPSFNWISTSEIQSIWLMDFFKKQEKPSKIDMIQKIKQDYNKAKSMNYEYIDLAICIYEYLDDLLMECGRLKYRSLYYKWLTLPHNKYWIK